ncbi:hypothetical protein LC612_31460 [Nostoc sp. CHAB 5834]|nr:hypothetical protein [Nostoc sp. CHAB 5834]
MSYNPLFNALPARVQLITSESSDGNILSKQRDDEDIPSPTDITPVTPVFLTPQSLASFPGASVAVNIIWNIAASIYQPLAKSPFVPIIAALVVGSFIYSQSVTDNMTKNQKIAAMFITILNSLWLAAIALGINVVTPPK